MSWEALREEIRAVAKRWKDAGRGAVICAPDDWIARVIELEGVDAASLAYLAEIAKRHGKVNIHHALRFVQIEDDIRERRAEEQRSNAAVSASPALQRLMAKASR
jgi:hypothetical protein